MKQHRQKCRKHTFRQVLRLNVVREDHFESLHREEPHRFCYDKRQLKDTTSTKKGPTI